MSACPISSYCRDGAVETIRVRPDVWATVQRIAASQPGSVIRIISEIRVEITY